MATVNWQTELFLSAFIGNQLLRNILAKDQDKYAPCGILGWQQRSE
jgi:hypothetical protein